MRGFLQKDIELLKQSRSFIGIVAVMTIFMVCVKNESFIIIYLGMMGGFLAMSTISYDEADHGMGFLMTLPASRKTYAIEKYILGYGVSFVLLLAGVVVSSLADMFRGVVMEPGEWLLTLETGILIVALFMVVLVPVQLKFGADNGRIVMAAVFMSCFGLIYLMIKIAESFGVDAEQVLRNMLAFRTSVIMLATAIFLIAASCISCRISIHIMERKEY